MDNCETGNRAAQADLPQIWRIRFDLIERAGGPALPRKKTLSASERFRTLFNFWALLFAPFYYLFKGMWRKALTYWLPGFLLLSLLDAVAPDIDWDLVKRAVGIGTAILFTLRANIDYYKKMVLNDNGWW